MVGLRLAPGANYGELGSSPMDQAGADDDLLAVGVCLSRYYGVTGDP